MDDKLNNRKRAPLLLLAALLLSACSSSEPAPDPPTPANSEPASAFFTAEDDLASMARFYHVENPPKVERIRWVTPEEAGAAREECLAEAGFPSSNGYFTTPTGQESAFELAQYICFAKYPTDPKYIQPWGAEQIKAQYSYTVDVLIPCLESHGYPIENVPSEGSFIDSWTTSPFYPFSQIPPTSNGEMESLDVACPQIMPSTELWK